MDMSHRNEHVPDNSWIKIKVQQGMASKLPTLFSTPGDFSVYAILTA